MFVTVVAVLCNMASNVCTEEIVTNSSLDSTVTFQNCMIGGQASLAKWKSDHAIYRSGDWHIERYKCAPGHFVLKARI
jgi:hypothetical protein